MPWIDEPPKILPIMPTGEPLPNPMRTWVDDLPMVLTMGGLIVAVLLIAIILPKLREPFVKIINHLRTPVG